MHANPYASEVSGRDPRKELRSSTPLLSTSFPEASPTDLRANRSQVERTEGLATERFARSGADRNARFCDSAPTHVAGRVAGHVAATLSRPEVAFTLTALAAVCACALSGWVWMPEGWL